MKKFLIISTSILIITLSLLVFNLFKSNSKKNITEELDITSSLVTELYNRVNPSSNSLVLSGLYENNTISNKYIIAVAISDYLNSTVEVPEFINELEIENKIHDIFGYDIAFNHEDAYVLNHNACGYYYRESISKYELIPGCGGNNMDAFYRKIIKAEKQNDTITITEKTIYVYDNWDDYISRVFVYNNYQKEKNLDYFEQSSNEPRNININNYLESASTYLYTFKLINGKYIFTSFKKI